MLHARAKYLPQSCNFWVKGLNTWPEDGKREKRRFEYWTRNRRTRNEEVKSEYSILNVQVKRKKRRLQLWIVNCEFVKLFAVMPNSFRQLLHIKRKMRRLVKCEWWIVNKWPKGNKDVLYNQHFYYYLASVASHTYTFCFAIHHLQFKKQNVLFSFCILKGK